MLGFRVHGVHANMFRLIGDVGSGGFSDCTGHFGTQVMGLIRRHVQANLGAAMQQILTTDFTALAF